MTTLPNINKGLLINAQTISGKDTRSAIKLHPGFGFSPNYEQILSTANFDEIQHKKKGGAKPLPKREK